jgi:hypothetical protein
MTNFNKIAFVIYRDERGRIYTHDVWLSPYPSKTIELSFVINYSKKKNKAYVYYSEQFKSTPILSDLDIIKFNYGEIEEIVDQSSCRSLPSPYDRPMLTMLYIEGCKGYGMN